MRVVLVMLGTLAVLAGASRPAAIAPKRVLFVGNSLTAANDLPALTRAILEAAGQGPIETAAVVKPGFSLEDHWTDGAARRAIARDTWTTVVLQQGPSSQPDSRVLLREYVRRFDREIRLAGATTALYMVWPPQARSDDFDGVSTSYTIAARDVKALLIPAGDAWRAAWRRDASLALYGEDRFHPSPLGSYLAALAAAETLAGRSLGSAPAPRGSPASADTEAVLRLASSEAVQKVRTTAAPTERPSRE